MQLSISALSIACLSLLNSGLALAADCPEASYTLTTQAEVDNFPANCDTVTGDLTVEGGGITNLNGLANLSVVGGNLEIINNPGIRFLRLPALTRVDGYFEIYGNKAMVSIDGLTRLSTVGATLTLDNNEVLSSLEGLEGLVSTGGLRIDSTPIVNLDVFNNLRTIAGFLWLGYLSDLQNIDGLRNVTRLDSMLLRNTEKLVDIDALAGVTTMSGDITIEDNSALRSISGLANVTDVGAHVEIAHNPVLRSIALNSLRYVRGVDDSTGLGLFIHSNYSDLYCGGLRQLFGYPVGLSVVGVAKLYSFYTAPNGSPVVGEYSLDRSYYADPSWSQQRYCGSSKDIVPVMYAGPDIAELYIGFLGRAPDPAGLVYWTRELADLRGWSATTSAAACTYGATKDETDDTSSDSSSSSGTGSTSSSSIRLSSTPEVLKKLANDIASSPEWFNGIGRHDPLTQSGAEAIVAEMYLNLFSRPATASDLEYWSYDLTTGQVTAAQMAVLLLEGAKAKRNADYTVLGYRHDAALHYVTRACFAGFDKSTARLAVKDVNSSATLQASKDASDKL